MMNKNGRIENLAIFGVGAAIVTAASIGVWLGSTWTKKPSSPKLETAHTNHTKLVLKTPEDKADETTRLLSEHIYSHEVKHTAGVTRFDGAQLASNSPCEDRFMYGKFPAPWGNGTNKPWMAWGIFDGHAGWQTAELLEKHLLPFVQLGLSQIEPISDRGFISASDKSIHRAITNGFLYLDDLIIEYALEISQNGQSLKEKMKVLAPAFAGSCAILALYDPITRSLHVACTGGSRAVLGHRTPNGNSEALPLSVDQTGLNKAEISRIAEEHPGEEGIINKSRVLGLAVSRAFGDGRWKWTSAFQEDFVDRFHAPKLSHQDKILTPPYLTAESVVRSWTMGMHSEGSKPALGFMIMASDGLWDLMSSQHAADLVGVWLDFQTQSGAFMKTKPWTKPQYAPFDFSDLERAKGKGIEWKFIDERTTVKDDNVAVHLMRNALGGNHTELLEGGLAVTAPFSRKLRDDITISVVFFGGDSRNGNENELKGSNKMNGGDKFSGKDDWKGGAWSEMWPREY